jgi:hypothetical protein
MSTLTISETLVAVIRGVTCVNPVAVMSAAFWRRRRLSEDETYGYVLQEYPCFPDSVFALLHTLLAVSRDSIVGIATRYGLDGPGFEFRQQKNRSRPTPGPIQPPIQWVPRFFVWGKVARAWSWLLTYVHSEDKNEWNCASAPSLWLHGVYIPLDFISCRIEVSKCRCWRQKFCGILCPVYSYIHVKWVPVTTAWRVLRLRMEERPPIWRVAANKLSKLRGQPTRGGPPAAWRLGEVLTTLPVKTRVKWYSQGEMLPLETKQSGR